jgi:hypothetical protein
MIPSISYKISELEEKEESNLTYKLDLEQKRIYGKIDDREACKQAILKIVLTERFENVIYSDNYGVELKRFIGKDLDFIKADICRTINEALLCDKRIISIEQFNVSNITNNSISITFNVSTIYGDIPFSSEVII